MEGMKRNWGRWLAAALSIFALLGLAACTPRDGELSEKELAQWEERLNTPEWSGFLTHLYSDVKYLNLSRVFASGAGLTQAASDGTVTVKAEEMEELLQQRTGQSLSDLQHTLSDWTYLEDSDSYQGQSREPEAAVTVTAGERQDGVVTLQVERQGEEPAFLTISEEEKILSYTNDQYNAVEAMALDLLAQTVRRVESGGGTVEGAYVSYLRCADQSEDGYYLWDVDYRIRTERGERLNAMESEMVNGWFTARTDRGAPRFVVAENGGEYTLVATLYSGDTSGMTWQEYVDFVMEQGIENADLNNGWPQLNEDMLTSLASGGRQWAISREGVIAAYLWQQGDELTEWETVSVREGSGQWMDQHSVVSAETAEGSRSYTLLLSHRNVPYEGNGQSVELSVWQVTGSKVHGDSLETVQLMDTSSAAAELTTFEAQLPEGESAYLAQGGGTYADYRWSICIPTSWSRSGERWYPDGEDLTVYLEVRSHEADYTDGDFYLSFANSFSRVQSNYGWGGETAWARGESDRGQVTEALLCRAGEEVWEVMWTYPFGTDTTLLSAAAATFRCGETGVTELGQEPQGPLLVEDRDDTWMVLGSFRALALEELLLDNSNTILKPYREAYYTYTFSQPTAEKITWVGAYPGQEGRVELFRVDLAVKAEPLGPEVPLDPARPEDRLTVDAEGFWHPEEPVWLAVEHDGQSFLGTAVLHGAAQPGQESLEAALKAAGDRGGRTMYLDPETGKITAARP